MGEWILPLSKRKPSGAGRLNCLWQSGSLYVMDNHRAALWCWWQHTRPGEPWNLLHIDRHYDALSSNLDAWLAQMPGRTASLQDYLAASWTVDGERIPVITWDNYLSLCLARQGGEIEEVLLATAGEGDRPRQPTQEEIDSWELLEHLASIIEIDEDEPHQSPWVINVDLDYFTAIPGWDEGASQVFHDEYIAKIGQMLVSGLANGRISCATIALSPETTGGWDLAERLLVTLLRPFGDCPTLTAMG